LVNTAAGGAGLSLHDLNGKYPRMAIISPTPSAVNLRQVLGRIHRDGAKSKALQKIVFAANTEEEDVCENVKKKLHNLDIINDGDLLNPSFMEKYTKVVKNT
jgi:superfamily II DNA or RNA helicase